MRALLAVTFILAPLALAAQAARPGDAILDALRLDALLAQMQAESVTSSAEIAQELLPDRRRDTWREAVRRINAPENVAPVMRKAFEEALDPAQAPAILSFYRGELGQRIVDLELSARAVLENDEIRQAVRDTLAAQRDRGEQRAQLVETFIDVNDLVDANVVSALNANAAFLLGLRAEAAPPDVAPQGDLYAEVMGQEPQLRRSTREWVEAFVSLAYRPLSDAEFRRYIDFARSESGQALNHALFAAFDAVFVSTSQASGRALGRILTTQEL